MKVALLVRDSHLARELADRVAARWEMAVIVSESGRAARRRKLKRELRRGFPWRIPLTFVDLLALWLLERAWNRYRRRRDPTGVAAPWPSGCTVVEADDANDIEAVEALRAAEPDVVLVLGTAILTGDTLRAAHGHVLNIHGGIVPQYRNVHSEFWAVMRDDVDHIGVSVLHLDEGIDSGAVAVQRRLEVEPGEPFFALRYRNTQLALDAALEALALTASGKLPASPQSGSQAGFHRTPGAAAILRFLLKTRRGVFARRA